MRGRRLILLYHRVVELERDPHGLVVSPEVFSAQLAVLQRRLAVVPLAQLLERAREDRVAITFDDGYWDAAGVARSVLESAGAPATVFVVAGAVGRAREFWWDRLEHLVLDRLAGSEVLDLSVSGTRLYVDTRSRAGLERAHRALYVRIRRHPLGAIERFLDDLGASAGNAPPREAYRALTAAELRELGASPWVEIGAHSLHHPHLSRLPGDEQRIEIGESRRRLEALTGGFVTSFSYPHGDVDASVARAVEEAGYSLACCSRPGLVSRWESRFLLPRQVVLGWEAEEFGRRLDAWLAG